METTVAAQPRKESSPSISVVSRPARVEVLPHEWVFGFYLALTGLRLALAGGSALAWSMVFWGCLAGSALVISWSGPQPGPLRWRGRLLYYPVIMGICFFAMGKSLPVAGTSKVDALLLEWDRALLGETPSVTWEPWLRPWLADVAMGCYLFFFFYLVTGPGRYCFRDLRLFRKCMVGLFTLYGLAFLGYLVFPAGGPWRWIPFETPLHGPLLLDWTLKPVNLGSNAVDVFPSIHFSATLYLLLFDWCHYRRRFWWVLLPCLILWFATMYLRFHYFVDLLAGAVVALVGWFMGQWYEQSAKARRVDAAD